MNATEAHDGQDPPLRYCAGAFPECRCNALAHGGCRCEDDGTVHRRVEHEALEHEPGGYPRKA